MRLVKLWFAHYRVARGYAERLRAARIAWKFVQLRHVSPEEMKKRLWDPLESRLESRL